MNSPGIYIEISQSSLKALRGDEGLEVALERSHGGRLTEACKGKVVSALQTFLQHKGWQMRPRAYCAIGARGVSLRRLTLPSTGKDDFQRVLLMQIESEFPLPPDELAWGCRSLGEARQNGTTKHDLLVVAVKKDVVEEYSALLSQCGVTPVFTVAAIARSGICPQPAGSYAILEIGDHQSELILFESGVPVHVRTLSLTDGPSPTLEALDSFARALNGSWSGKKLFASGSEAGLKAVSSCLSERFSSGFECAPLPAATGKGRSTAILGLKKSVESGDAKLVFFQSRQSNGKANLTSRAPMKWAVTAAALLISLVLLPYTEAFLLKPWLEKKLTAIKADAGRLTTIDRELGFLQFLKQNQPPYLDSIYLFAKSAPQGAKIDSLTMNRRGEVSLRASMRNADQVAEFRTKLISSGFFSSVAVEEQTPTPDQQKVNVRITAQWKPANVLQTLAIGPTAEEIEKARANKDSQPGRMPSGPGGMPPGAMPAGGLPPGFSPDKLPPGVNPADLPPEIRAAMEKAAARKEGKK